MGYLVHGVRVIHDWATEHITLRLDWDASFNIPSLATKGSAPNSNMCVWTFSLQQEIVQHQHGLLQFNSVLTWYTWRWHQIPQNKCSVLQDWGCPSGTVVKKIHLTMQETQTWVWFLGWEDPLEEEMVNPLQYSYWENPMDRGLQSMGLQRCWLDTIEYPCMHIHTWLFPLPQIPITSPGCHLCFSPAGFRLEVPVILSLSSINFLEQLTDLRETFHLLDYWFIWKDITQE